MRLGWGVIAGKQCAHQAGVHVVQHPLSDVPVGGLLRTVWVHLPAIALAGEAQHVIELRYVTSLQIIAQNHFIPCEVVHREAIEFHQLTRIPLLLLAPVERDGLEELGAVYSELSLV